MRMTLTVDDILSAPDDDLRAAIRAICTDDNKVRDRLATYLHKVQNPAAKLAPKKSKNAPKVDPSGIFLCGQCEKTFLEPDNHETACTYHTGECEVNEEAWQDMYTEADPDYDNPEMRKSFPKGFQFECCGEIGDHPGCKTGKHKTNETLSQTTINSAPTQLGIQQQQTLAPGTATQPQQAQPLPLQQHIPVTKGSQYPTSYQQPLYQQPQQPVLQQTAQPQQAFSTQPANQEVPVQPQWFEPRPITQPGPARPGFRYVNPLPSQPYPLTQPPSQQPMGYQWQYVDVANNQPQDVNTNKRRRVDEVYQDSSEGYVMYPGQSLG